jgi:tRNA(adenine34) deaminase
MEKSERYMEAALKQAAYAFDDDEVPVGAVIVYENKIIAQSYNQVERLKDPTAHAEMIAITQAASFLKSKWLRKCSMYVTLEPCLMCAGALVLSRIDKVYFGAADSKAGACGSCCDINEFGLNHRLRYKRGLLEVESAGLLKDFFKAKRGSKQPVKPLT